ncbi:hypothetical protein QAD02_012752 [Eretmocerus hayati]|uniref:Uncharacterized protein n=1 Tax=Eretmocerus hayati TaxID=131215 RepID=A0ACC2P5C0_9HYME|nr:hypothetical protein QAD02_012752 [Eretmocerus hayati]
MNMIDDGLHGGDKKKCHDVLINDRQIRLDSDDETNTACPRRDKRQNKETLNGTPGTTDGSQTYWTLKHDGHVDAISSGKIIYEEMPANNKQTDELVLGNVETIRDLRRRNLLDSPKHLLEDCQLVDKISGDLSDLFNLRSGIDGDDATFENQIDTRSEQDIEGFCKENICGKCQDPSDVGKRGDLILFDGFCERCEDKMNSPTIEDIGGNLALGYEGSNPGSNDDFCVNDRRNLYVEIENSDEYVVGRCDFIEPYTKEDELRLVKRICSPSAVRTLRPKDPHVYNYENEILKSYILLDLCGSLIHELEISDVLKDKMPRSGTIVRVQNTENPYLESKFKLGHIVSCRSHQFHPPRKKSRYSLIIKDTFSIIGKMQAPIRLHADVLIHGKPDVRVKRSVNDEQDRREEARTPVVTFEKRDSHLKNINSTFLSENGSNLVLHNEQNGITPFMDIELIEAQDAGTRGLKITANIDNDVAIIVHIRLTKKRLVREFKMTSEGNSSLKKNVRALFGDESDKLGESESNKLRNEDKTHFSAELKIKMRDNSAQNDKSLQTRPIRDDEKGQNTVLDFDLLFCSRGLETELRRNRLITINETRRPQLMNIQNNDPCMRLKDAQQEYDSNNRGHQPEPPPDGKNETEQDPTYENVDIVMRPKPPHLYPYLGRNESMYHFTEQIITDESSNLQWKNMAVRAPRWDGVRPEEYPENYHDLLSYSCITKHPGIEQYYVSYWTGILECDQCYRRDHYSIAEMVGRVDTVHMIVPRNSIYCECERCGTRILVERPVIRCGMCSDQYFPNLILINVRQQREGNAHLQAREMNGDDSDIEVISESDKGSDSESGDQADPEDLSINPRERFRQEMEQSNPIYDRQ